MMASPDEAEDLTCAICLEYYNDPLTLSCGHSFCRVCLLQSTRMAPDGRSCPNCRATIEIRAPLTHPADAALEERLDAHFRSLEEEERDLRAARAVRDEETLARLASNAASSLPVFYMPGAQDRPGAAVNLFLFEPRYRILIRRAWEGDKSFVCLNRSGGPRRGDVGLLVRVEAANFLRDGRAHVRGVGMERVALGDCWQEPDTGGLWYSATEAAASPETDVVRASARGNYASSSSSSSTTLVYHRIQSAISEGAPAYNRGRAEFCARRYLTEATEILGNPELVNGIGGESGRLTETLRLAVASAQRDIGNEAYISAAWSLRRAFDAILRHRNRGPTAATVRNLGWLPIFFYSGLRVPTDGTTASFQLFELRYRELAREVMEKDAHERFFLCCSGPPRAGGKATMVRMDGCDWASDDERANVVVRGVRNVKLTDTRTDGDRGNLMYGKAESKQGVARILAFFRR